MNKLKTALAYRRALALADKKLLAEESGFSYLPGLSNIVAAPLAVYYDIKKLRTSGKVGDHETLNDFGIRLGQNSVAFFAAAFSTISYAESYVPGLACPSILSTVARYGSFLGLLLCFLEGLLESVALVRQTTFHFSPLLQFSRFLEKHKEIVDEKPQLFIKELKQHLHLLLTEHLAPAEKKRIQETLAKALNAKSDLLTEIYAKDLQHLASSYLAKAFAKSHFDGQNVGKVVALQRRVGIWAAKDLDKRLITLSKEILSHNPSTEKKASEAITRIFKRLDEQSLKKLFIHVVGLAAVILTAASMVLFLGTGIGGGVIGGLFLAGAVFSFLRYATLSGVFSQDGWNFSPLHCLPTLVLERINHQRDKHLASAVSHSFLAGTFASSVLPELPFFIFI